MHIWGEGGTEKGKEKKRKRELEREERERSVYYSLKHIWCLLFLDKVLYRCVLKTSPVILPQTCIVT
jgi:hypothetical protein